MGGEPDAARQRVARAASTRSCSEKPTIAAPPRPVPLTRLRGEIEFRNASVAYPSGRALDDVSLMIEAGATVAVVRAYRLGHKGRGNANAKRKRPLFQ